MSGTYHYGDTYGGDRVEVSGPGIGKIVYQGPADRQVALRELLDAVQALRTQVSGADRQVAWVERWFPRVGPVLIFVAPNNPVCLLAGSTRMSPLKFVVLNAGGTAARCCIRCSAACRGWRRPSCGRGAYVPDGT